MININYSNFDNKIYGAMNQAMQDCGEQAKEHTTAQMSASNAGDTGVILTLSSSSVLQKGEPGRRGQRTSAESDDAGL